MAWWREIKVAWAVLATALGVLAWAYLSLIFFRPLPWSAGFWVSLLSLLFLLLAGGVLIQWSSRAPFSRLSRLVTMLAKGGLRERLYVEDTESESGRVQLLLNSLLDQMEETMSRQRQFVSAISHDIRTPLTIMKGDIEVALMRKRTGGEYEEILRSNLEEVERIHRLVEDLVTLARADYGEMGLNVRAVALGSLVAEVRESFLEAARRKDLTLDFYLEGDVQIEGDQTKLRQLLHNLVDNAIHYTLPGGRIELSLLHDRERDQVQLRVKDTGIGISPRDLPHVFEPFYRGTHSRRTRHDGYGLGLAICDHIVRAHGGRIGVESQEGPGGGTTFTVHLPKRPLRG